ncbi:hypothetical protein O6H91_08G010300 [Diphasiastrum complanatum]|uniref:Uncharacterized protein n=1 Tax=Diphasiastrum complanatum TaxID=34168 RepID=A0ACC2CUV3_DIPCM|nr:hypothetical protein O6H91_08G010300 [Diphasiastrum complanatum]
MILPLAKLGTLALKTLSKPLATRLKVQASRHPRFRNIIINLAQVNHKFSVNLQRRIYGHSTDVAIHPLDEEKAVQAASDLLGESVVFVIAGAAVIFEVSRNARSEARKEEARKHELQDLRNKDEQLLRQIEMVNQRLDELEKAAKGGIRDWLPLPNILHGHGHISNNGTTSASV